jgi:hypothetical protein
MASNATVVSDRQIDQPRERSPRRIQPVRPLFAEKRCRVKVSTQNPDEALQRFKFYGILAFLWVLAPALNPNL